MPEATDPLKQALIEQSRRLDLDEPLPPEPVILRDDLRYNRSFRLNHTSAQIAAWCSGEWTVAEIERKMVDRFDCSPEEAHRAVREVVDFLAQRRMLEGARRRLQRWGFFLNPMRLARILKYLIGYYFSHREDKS